MKFFNPSSVAVECVNSNSHKKYAQQGLGSTKDAITLILFSTNFHINKNKHSYLKEIRLPVVLKCCPSRDPVVENAQHEPQSFWFLTGVTYPSFLQSICKQNKVKHLRMVFICCVKSW